MGVPEVTRSAVAAPDAARRTELGACLRAYRELTSPGAAGLPERGRRRTPGLRREEVATLAGVGLSWYTWLEQGRVTASPEVIDAVGRVLGVDEEGRRHLRALAGPAVAAPDPDRVRADLAPLLAGWREGPAAVLDHRLDLVAVNDVWTRAWGGAAGENALEVLAVRARGAGPLGRADDLVRALARRFRMAANTHADDPRIAEVRARLRTAVPDLAPLWDCRGVGAFTPPDVTWQGTPSRAYLLHPTGEPGAAVLAVVPV
ncbi:helix-turn-helix domain-containing protein [Pseudonocardia sp. NPDC049154]|uniref:helix-turn-helix domain-containing protein n=1 Tax=Pseudonocardia sp. NPDC049154 TaxID=3155501 RepID=UPI0033E13582